MASKTVKVAVSLPEDLFKRLEKVRRRQDVSRSAAFREALEAWLRDLQEREDVRRYIEGYRRMPETREEMKAFEKLALTALSHEEWE